MIRPTAPAPIAELSFEDVTRAAARIAPHVRRTPVVSSPVLDELAGALLYFKCENLQHVGAFKFRGATNAVFSLDEASAARGVVTHSSGNHGAALALAARLRGIAAHIVVPEGAAETKVEAIRSHGANLVRCGPTLSDREEAATRIAAQTGAELIHPYNDLRVMAGQGTAALEFLHEIPDLDILITPVSGGGLLSGSATAGKHLRPSIKVFGAEPAGADDAARSLAAGTIIRDASPRTICDGLRSCLGPLTFAVIVRRVDGIAVVDDADTLRAMQAVWENLEVVVEPSAAVALAAVLAHRLPAGVVQPGSKIGIVLTGGNVDLDRLPWA